MAWRRTTGLASISFTPGGAELGGLEFQTALLLGIVSHVIKSGEALGIYATAS